jgi:FkbM family methyltransferase
MEIRDLLDQPREVLERFCEQKCQYAYLGDGEALTRVLGKYMMYVDSHDTSVAPHLMLNGYWESWITQALVKLKPGIRCADIGANHGYFTMVLADLCKSDVIAFEPQHHLAEMVRRSAAVCGYRTQVVVIEAAVGAESGQVRLVAPPGEPNNTGSVWCEGARDISEISIAEAAAGVPPAIPMVSLDDAVPGELGFIKMDAEGYEPLIWAGMARHLQSRPTILMEFTPCRYDDAGGFLDEIEKCYTLREVDNGGNIVPAKREALLDNADFSMLWLEAD